jgi:maltooligosyltrehalose trehalohydrolase
MKPAGNPANTSETESSAAPFTFGFGAVVQADGRTRFRLWAPSVSAGVALEFAGQPPIPMWPAEHGFYEITVAAAPGSCYRYRISPDMTVPDPASRLQAGDVGDDSIVVDTTAYAWKQQDWRGRPWEETVLYELHSGLCGGYSGIEQRLAGLNKLGVTAIELMPIGDFPGKRNWGYDGVLPYAPDTSYGTPDELKHLIDAAHGIGMMVFLDVVYNHFGPDGNYLHTYAKTFFTEDKQTPWGPAIDFNQDPVRRFFAENALYWLKEYRFDGLRLDGVHAILEPDWLPEMADFMRSHLPADRHVHLVLENDDNVASHLTRGFNAQWNDDGHHVVHHLLTGEENAYYVDYAREPAVKLARVLSQGFVYQGEPSQVRNGEPRGHSSAHLPPSAFVFFLQNHDQIGNRAMGERLIELSQDDGRALRAAVAMQLLTPQIPLIFMGEERGSSTPFLYFTDHADAELAHAVRDGRRREFAGFNEFADKQARERIPDPNDHATYAASDPGVKPAGGEQSGWLSFYTKLLALRHEHIVPHLAATRSLGADAVGSHAVMARWQLSDSHRLILFTNLGSEDAALAESLLSAADVEAQARAKIIFESEDGLAAAVLSGRIPAGSTLVFIRKSS